MRLRHLALLLALLAACASEDDGAPTPAPALSDTDLDSPPTVDTKGEPAPIDPSTLVGRTWAIELDAETIREHCAAPPSNPLLCSQLGTWDGAVSRLAFQLVSYEGDMMEMAFAFLDAENHRVGERTDRAFVEWVSDRDWTVQAEDLQIGFYTSAFPSDTPTDVAYDTELVLEGRLALHEGGLAISRLKLRIAFWTTPGADPCELEPNNPCCLGFATCDISPITLALDDLTARPIQGLDLTPPLDPSTLDGKTWVVELGNMGADGHCASPPNSRGVCETLPGLWGKVSTLAFYFSINRNNETLWANFRQLDPDGIPDDGPWTSATVTLQDSGRIRLKTGEWDMQFREALMWAGVEVDSLDIPAGMEWEGWLDSSSDTIRISKLWLNMALGSHEYCDYFGQIDACCLGICMRDLFYLQLTDLTARPAPGIDPSPPLDADSLAGKTYLIEINSETAGNTCASLPTHPLACEQLPGLIGGSAIRIALQFEISDAGQLAVYAASLDRQLQQNGNINAVSPVVFTEDEGVHILFERLDFLSDMAPARLVMEATALPDLSGLNIARLRFNQENYCHRHECGIDPCSLGICDVDGTIILEFHNLTARLAPEIDLEPPAP